LFVVRPDNSEFYLGSHWYNSSADGLGIGAEGSWTAPIPPWFW
jgi:hypothetical protein